MRTLHATGLAIAIATGFALPLAGSAQAAMGGALPSTQILPVEQAQFFFLGHNFCWYDDGWQGPGWYWCDYAWNTGYGWGGGEGWHGWNRSAYHGPRSLPRPVYRGHDVRQPIIQPTYPPKITSGFKPHNNFVPGPNIKGGAFSGGAPFRSPAAHGAPLIDAGHKGGGGPGGQKCPPGTKC